MSNFDNYREEYRELGTRRNEAVTVSFINQVYGWMCGGLLLTALASWFILTSDTALKAIRSNSGLVIVLLLVELGLVFGISWGINRISAAVAGVLFIIYSIVSGITLSLILVAYTPASLASTFLITACMFGGMCVYGFVTKRDLTSLGALFLMALLGLIVASVVNIFLRSSGLEWAISIIGIIIFTGLTAYDAQKIKNMSVSMDSSSDRESVGKMAILGALSLYLDFINLFIMLLRIFGNRR